LININFQVNNYQLSVTYNKTPQIGHNQNEQTPKDILSFVFV